MAARKTISFHTFGCKLNFTETSAIARSLPDEEFKVVMDREQADIFVIHSCTVTGAAEKKCNQYIRHLKRLNPDAAIVVMGCYAQLDPQKLKAMPEVSLVLGNTDKFQLAGHLKRLVNETLAVPKQDESGISSFVPAYSLGDRTRSFLKIQDGCDYFCSYCAIPYARGRSRSAPIADVIAEARLIAASSTREIVLTGVNIGDFGKPNGETFEELLRALEQEVDIPRIRISSIEPDLLTDGIIRLVAASRKFMPHFHIPLQSGSDRILKAMHRKYKRRLFAGKVKAIKTLIPDCCIAADIITGFPGEEEDDFNETFLFIQELDISYLHVFSYSERRNTVSARLGNNVSPEVIKQRSKVLHALSSIKKDDFYRSQMGKTKQVLFESDPGRNFLFGFTENYIHVKTDFSKELINKILPVVLTNRDVNGDYVLILQD
jgi:threonylcarbamoyladenosine tRNA methylthiotransferase MtaB